jgi:Domain of unknown function (DU1801)
MGDAVADFLGKVASPTRRRDAETLLELMSRVTGEPARMWGPSIVGFGHYHYRYDSGREGDGPAASFSPRKAATTIYLPDGAAAYADLLHRLGPHAAAVGCLYVKDLAQIDLGVLEQIVGESYRTLTAGTYPNRASDHR